MLTDVALLGADTSRTRAYLYFLHKNGIQPAHVVLMGGGVGCIAGAGKATTLFENDIVAAVAAQKAGIPNTIIDGNDVNAPPVAKVVGALRQSIVIFSGPPGAIVREPLFETGKRFLHVHAGRLPAFRGSTTIYYGLLAEDRITASALFLEPSIDSGPVVGSASYRPPEDRTLLDSIFDSYVRADLLVRVLRRYADLGRFDEVIQSPSEGETYYIIHPVLKHIAILAGGIGSGANVRSRTEIASA